MNFQQAFKAHQQGQYELAEKGYTAILQNNPNHAASLHLLGCLKKQQNKYNQAVQLIETAIGIAPNIAIYHYNLGFAYFDMLKIQQAIDAWQKTIALDPKLIDAYANIGYALIQQNELQKAQEILIQGYKKAPQNQLILLNLATACHKDEAFDKARQYYEKLLFINEKHVEALKGYGRLLYKTGHLIESINCQLYLTHFQPDCVDTWYHLGCAYQDNCQDEDAVKCFRHVLSLDPKSTKAYYHLGNIEKDKGQLTSAKKYYEAALDQNPNYVEVLVVLGTLCLDMADYENAHFFIQKALNSNKDKFLSIGSIHLYQLNFMPDIPRFQIFQNHLEWGDNMIASCEYSYNPKLKVKDKIRIGYVSPDFRVHSIAYFILSVLKNHDRNHFKIFIYSNVARADHVTENIRQFCHVYRNIRGMSTMSAGQLIYEDKIDILIDLAGHTHANRLDIFAMKPAPIQMTYLGYPGTTGLTTIDYRITDTIADSIDDTDHYTEKLIQIPAPFVCYQPPDNAPDVSDLPMNKNGYITFGSFNYLGKINKYVIQLWAKLLNQIPDARLVLKSRPFHDSLVCKRFQDMFASKGISEERLDLRGSNPGLNMHLSNYHDIDIGLDPFPYNGTTTTCEALWMGVPVLTITGKYHSERVGTALMQSIGLKDWIAANDVQFLKKAYLLARQPNLLSKLRQQLRTIMKTSDLCNGAQHAQRLESVYKKIVAEGAGQKN
jgi:predicted O-linked N-acetylglucosamine transferase (SPINDLY family)